MQTGLKPNPEEWRPPLVVLVGMGMSAEDLSPRVLSWIERADVLVGAKRLLDCFPDHTGERIPLLSSLDETIERLRAVARNRRTVVLASGDPFFFGIGRRLVQALGKEHVFALPNVTSVQALFARLLEPWDDVKVVSLHGRSETANAGRWLDDLRHCSRMAFFTDPRRTPAWIAREMLAAGYAHHTMIVAEDIGLPTERIGRFTLREAADRAFSTLNLVAVFADRDHCRAPAAPFEDTVLGLPEEAFMHEAGLITKTEVRAVVLAHLLLQPGKVLWDVGSGSGSVSIEAARVGRLREVIAVERNEDRFRDLVANIERFRCPEVRPVFGSALQVLAGAPDPDRVFIGGSGGELPMLLDMVSKRLRPGGRVVQTAVTLDTLEAARSFWLGKPFEVCVVQLQVSRSAPIGGTLRLEALNPVFIVTVRERT